MLLSAGFTALGFGTVVAYLNPATGYEPSVYTGTPALFWVGSVAALLAAVTSTFYTSHSTTRRLGTLLGGLSMTAVVALPVIRGYQYLGEGDALSHLGFARDLDNGVATITGSRYPSVHTLGSITSDVSALELTHSMLLFVVIFVLAFFVFVPLTLRELTTDPRVVLAGSFSGLLLLQLNFLGVHTQVHATSQAVMFAAVILYLFIANYRRTNWRFVAMFLVASPMFVMLHPQQAANFTIFFGTVAVAQFVYSSGLGWTELPRKRAVIPSTTAFVFVFWLWSNNLPAFETSFSGFVVSLFTATDAASEITNRGLSISQLGGSLGEVFVKLFLVAAVYSLLAGVLMLAVTTNLRRFPGPEIAPALVADLTDDAQMLLFYFCAGFVAVTSLFFAYLVGNITSQYFRHYGFLMVFVTVMGAITLGRGLSVLETRIGGQPTRLITVVLLSSLLLISVLVVHPSPYIYKTSGHVPESQISGYELAFEHGQQNLTYDHVRSPADRYGNAINGKAARDRRDYYREGVRRGGVPDQFANRSLREYFDQRVYLGITSADRIRDGVVFDGFRFSREDFAYVDSEPGIDKVQSSEGFDLYLVHPAESNSSTP